MISVIIPAFNRPKMLDLCLESAIKGQVNKNQIIVVIDGTYDLLKDVLEKYKDDIKTVILESTQGAARATNLGVYEAINKLILITHDDMVFPKNWDERLEPQHQYGFCFSPNQIIPYREIEKQFIVENLARAPHEFDFDDFYKFEETQQTKLFSNDGSSFPIFISKIDFLKMGGFDETYPGNHMFDWEFFMKCRMVGLQMIRLNNICFYHFGLISMTWTKDELQLKLDIERKCRDYFKHKWGGNAYSDPDTNDRNFYIIPFDEDELEQNKQDGFRGNPIDEQLDI
jgi:glycosyltransferase involved in cell wall biosynthesis